MRKVQHYIHEIEKALKAEFASDKKAKYKDLKKYIGTQYDFIGLSVPTQRKVFKNGCSIEAFPFDEQLKIWDAIWKESNLFEVLSQCLYFIKKHVRKADPKVIWKITRQWVPKVDNWVHSDELSVIFSLLLERETEMIFSQLQKWNTSSNPWERRQSLVAMVGNGRKGKKMLPVDTLLDMIENVLEDEDYFVQKGVGWLLRETGNVYSKETYRFLKENIIVLHPVAFTAATEKIAAAQKDELKSLRKSRLKKKAG